MVRVKRARNSIIVRHNDPRISRTNLWYLSGVAKTEVNDRAKQKHLIVFCERSLCNFRGLIQNRCRQLRPIFRFSLFRSFHYPIFLFPPSFSISILISAFKIRNHYFYAIIIEHCQKLSIINKLKIYWDHSLKNFRKRSNFGIFFLRNDQWK